MHAGPVWAGVWRLALRIGIGPWMAAIFLHRRAVLASLRPLMHVRNGAS